LILYLGAIVVLIYVGWGLALLCIQPKLLYRPVREVGFTPADLGLEYEEVTFRSADGVALAGWYVSAKNAPFTVLLCHGNGGNIMYCLDSFEFFHNLGLSCLVFDYRGYGNSAGRPTEAGTYLDARTAYDWLARTKAVPADQIVLFGRSLGGSIAAHLAARVSCHSLVVESAFTSYLDMAAALYTYLPVRWVARLLFGYDTLASIREVRCPVMVIHSRDDELVPFELGVQLFEAAREPKRFVEIFGSHNDGYRLSADLYKEAWLQWLASANQSRSKVAVSEASQHGQFASKPDGSSHGERPSIG
jgi:uncharacterized protein